MPGKIGFELDADLESRSGRLVHLLLAVGARHRLDIVGIVMARELLGGVATGLTT